MWKKYCIATQYCRVVQATEGNTMLRKEYCALHVEQLRQETEKIRNIENLLLRNCLILSDFDQKKNYCHYGLSTESVRLKKTLNKQTVYGGNTAFICYV